MSIPGMWAVYLVTYPVEGLILARLDCAGFTEPDGVWLYGGCTYDEAQDYIGDIADMFRG